MNIDKWVNGGHIPKGLSLILAGGRRGLLSRERIIKGKKEECVRLERLYTKGRRRQRKVSKHEGKRNIGGRVGDRKQIGSGPKGFSKSYVLPTSLKEIVPHLTPMEDRE